MDTAPSDPGSIPYRHHEFTERPFPSRETLRTETESRARHEFPVSNGVSTDGLGPTFDCHRSRVTRPDTPAAASRSGRVLITSAEPFVLENVLATRAVIVVCTALVAQRPSTSLSYEELLTMEDVYQKEARYSVPRRILPENGYPGKGRNLGRVQAKAGRMFRGDLIRRPPARLRIPASMMLW